MAFYRVGPMATFEKHGYKSNPIFFFFLKRGPTTAFYKNAAIVLLVATCFNRGYRLNKIYIYILKGPIAAF